MRFSQQPFDNQMRATWTNPVDRSSHYHDYSSGRHLSQSYRSGQSDWDRQGTVPSSAIVSNSWRDSSHSHQADPYYETELFHSNDSSMFSAPPYRTSGSAFRRNLSAMKSSPFSREYQGDYYNDNEYSSGLYDFNDLNHTFRGLEGSFVETWELGDSLWVNVPSNSSSDPPAPRSVFGFSDNVYLDPLDCEGMSVFNTGQGIYAPRPHFSNPPLNRSESFSSHSSHVSTERIISQKKTPASSLASIAVSNGGVNPPIHLSQLWQEPVYRRIWDGFDGEKQRYLSKASQQKVEGDKDLIKRRIEVGIQEKKICHITKSRTIFVELVLEYGSNIQVWLEFCRLEMECGEYKNSRIVLMTACTQHPHNELLLQKRLRVEERLRSVNEVIELLNELRYLDTQKSMKIMVEGLSVLAKLGYEKMAYELGSSVTYPSKYYTGNLYYGMMLGEQRAGRRDVLLSLANEALKIFPKYGPLWFFCFDLFEHELIITWNSQRMYDLLKADRIEAFAEQAHSQLTSDILWKVYLLRVYCWLRSCMYMRSVTFDDVNLLLTIHL